MPVCTTSTVTDPIILQDSVVDIDSTSKPETESNYGNENAIDTDVEPSSYQSNYASSNTANMISVEVIKPSKDSIDSQDVTIRLHRKPRQDVTIRLHHTPCQDLTTTINAEVMPSSYKPEYESSSTTNMMPN